MGSGDRRDIRFHLADLGESEAASDSAAGDGSSVFECDRPDNQNGDAAGAPADISRNSSRSISRIAEAVIDGSSAV